MRRVLCILALSMLAFAACGRQTASQGDRKAAAQGEGDANGPVAPAGVAEAASTDPYLQAPGEGYRVRQGRLLYLYYCATCHGDEGHGDGLNAYNLDPKPRDLADPGFQESRTNDDLAAVIRSGGGVSGLSTAMPPWGRTLGDRRIEEIVDYLRALPARAE